MMNYIVNIKGFQNSNKKVSLQVNEIKTGSVANSLYKNNHLWSSLFVKHIIIFLLQNEF